jgi:ammonium transporter, Amt family
VAHNRSFLRYSCASITTVFGSILQPTSLLAQDTGPVLNSGDTAWILVATALVLFMTIPALALFYAGLVRTKNVLSLLMQCLALTALMSVVWVICGYSLAFDTTGMVKDSTNVHTFVGGLSKVMMNNVTPDKLQGTIPEILFAAYQMTFAIITPALMIGAFCERMKFSAVLVFSTLWLLIVYAPICHMTWGGPGALFFDWGVMDFAGGIVVHVTAGFGALVACLMVGPRAGYPRQLEPPHNMTMTVTGTAMLWVGWYGFNAGSALAADGSAAMALFVTHLSASIATLVWMAIEWIKLGRPSVLGAATGSIAGLAAITPASGFVGPMGALIIGACSAVLCFIFAAKIKQRVGYDDSLDVFGVHGVGGFLGTILCGVFASSAFGGRVDSTTYDVASRATTQLLAAASTAIYTVIATFVILKALQLTMGLRVDGNAETRGLDLSEHEERGYILH